MGDFERIFKTRNEVRDAFLARLFGIFNEKVVKAWCECEKALYEDLGRPTLYETGKRGKTLDFTLRNRRDGKTYIAELKCELQYQNYKRLRLCETSLVDNHIRNEAFKRFLEMAQDPHACLVKVNGNPTTVDGAILIWGAVSDLGRKSSRDKYDFADVLSVEEMIKDLNDWKPAHWIKQVENLRCWSDELFDYLLGQQGT